MIYYTKKPKKLWLTLLQYLLCGNVSTTSLIKYSCTTNHIADLVCVTNCLAIHTLHTVHWTQGRQSTSLELKEDMKGRRNFSCVQLLVTLWTIAYHAPLSKGFSRQKYWSGLPFPSPGYLPNPGLLDCRWILYQLSHKGSPRILERVAYLFSSRSSWLRNRTGVSCIAVDSLPAEPSGKFVGTADMLILSWLPHQPHHNLSPLVADPVDTDLVQE